MNTTTTYKFADLSKEAKERAVDKHREGMCDGYDWWDNVFEDWVEKLRALDYEDIDIQFSGFWSQGDGASFTARRGPNHDTDEAVQAAWLQLKAAAALLGGTLDKWADLPDLAWGNVHRIDNRHSHEYTVRVDWENYADGPGEDEDDLTLQWHDLHTAIENYYEDLTETVRDLCREIYSDLETEYEYLTADEQVIESIESLDVEFDEEGDVV